ncbi:MAG: MerR family transcriptional regulator [Treponema sp.]|nr:MerR family transcriptional regulator [Treponema sp.]MBQ7618950.1 MerR family transcriptional regulator [Treponema sp.]
MYTIGQVEEITGVKQHVLRYWEEVIPGFAPKKDLGGRRLYSQKDMEIVLRMKHLIYQKKFTIEGARNQIISESCAFEKSADLLVQLRAARRELTEAFFALRKFR